MAKRRKETWEAGDGLKAPTGFDIKGIYNQWEQRDEETGQIVRKKRSVLGGSWKKKEEFGRIGQNGKRQRTRKFEVNPISNSFRDYNKDGSKRRGYKRNRHETGFVVDIDADGKQNLRSLTTPSLRTLKPEFRRQTVSEPDSNGMSVRTVADHNYLRVEELDAEGNPTLLHLRDGAYIEDREVASDGSYTRTVTDRKFGSDYKKVEAVEASGKKTVTEKKNLFGSITPSADGSLETKRWFGSTKKVEAVDANGERTVTEKKNPIFHQTVQEDGRAKTKWLGGLVTRTATEGGGTETKVLGDFITVNPSDKRENTVTGQRAVPRGVRRLGAERSPPVASKDVRERAVQGSRPADIHENAVTGQRAVPRDVRRLGAERSPLVASKDVRERAVQGSRPADIGKPLPPDKSLLERIIAVRDFTDRSKEVGFSHPKAAPEVQAERLLGGWRADAESVTAADYRPSLDRPNIPVGGTSKDVTERVGRGSGTANIDKPLPDGPPMEALADEIRDVAPQAQAARLLEGWMPDADPAARRGTGVRTPVRPRAVGSNRSTISTPSTLGSSEPGSNASIRTVSTATALQFYQQGKKSGRETLSRPQRPLPDIDRSAQRAADLGAERPLQPPADIVAHRGAASRSGNVSSEGNTRPSASDSSAMRKSSVTTVSDENRHSVPMPGALEVSAFEAMKDSGQAAAMQRVESWLETIDARAETAETGDHIPMSRFNAAFAKQQGPGQAIVDHGQHGAEAVHVGSTMRAPISRLGQRETAGDRGSHLSLSDGHIDIVLDTSAGSRPTSRLGSRSSMASTAFTDLGGLPNNGDQASVAKPAIMRLGNRSSAASLGTAFTDLGGLPNIGDQASVGRPATMRLGARSSTASLDTTFSDLSNHSDDDRRSHVPAIMGLKTPGDQKSRGLNVRPERSREHDSLVRG
jgi:hypothetical protein